eukprot:7386102-Prymnesium_polylepis.1
MLKVAEDTRSVAKLDKVRPLPAIHGVRFRPRARSFTRHRPGGQGARARPWLTRRRALDAPPAGHTRLAQGRRHRRVGPAREAPSAGTARAALKPETCDVARHATAPCDAQTRSARNGRSGGGGARALRSLQRALPHPLLRANRSLLGASPPLRSRAPPPCPSLARAPCARPRVRPCGRAALARLTTVAMAAGAET